MAGLVQDNVVVAGLVHGNVVVAGLVQGNVVAVGACCCPMYGDMMVLQSCRPGKEVNIWQKRSNTMNSYDLFFNHTL